MATPLSEYKSEIRERIDNSFNKQKKKLSQTLHYKLFLFLKIPFNSYTTC